MPSLTLILSDLYLPEEAARDAVTPATLELPNLAWLLRFAGSVAIISDWRGWLAAELKMVSLAGLPVAEVAARAFFASEVAATAWLATPVCLEARLDHVRLVDRGLLRVSAEEGADWCQEFARGFGPDLALHSAGERGFFLTGLKTVAATVDPARLLDADVASALPRGADTPELRRLGAEIEMWLHAAPLNAARERARLPRISAFWLWGGGARRESRASAVAQDRVAAVALYGGDPFLAGLSRAAQVELPLMAPENYGALQSKHGRQVVECAPMSGAPRESLLNLEQNWFAPARVALSGGGLDSLDLVANDRCFRVAKRPGWRVWRRKRDWLAMLGRGIPSA
jgi:hypothetical protein